MNKILKFTKQNGLLSRLNGTLSLHNKICYSNQFFAASSKATAISYSKKAPKDDKCRFNEHNKDLLQKIGSAPHVEDSTSKSCPIFYTGPPTKKSICEQRRIKKCLKDQYEHGCKVDKSKCRGLAPDCTTLPSKEYPGRVKAKKIPGAPKTGWERLAKAK